MIQQKMNIAIIGAGRLGSALAGALHKKGYRVNAVIDKDLSAAKKISSNINSKIYSSDIREIPGVDVIFISVPDDSIGDVVGELERQFADKKLADFIYHTSGALISDVFAPLKKYGVSAASFHPIQTFSGAALESQKFQNIFIGIEGDERAVEIAKGLIQTLGCNSLLIPKNFKPIYHLACTMASNCLNALMSTVVDLVGTINFSEREALNSLFPLIITTLNNMQEQGVEKSLTGPVSRGDVSTVKKHLQILSESFPQYKSIYQQLGKITLEYKSVQNSISGQSYQELQQLLNNKGIDND